MIKSQPSNVRNIAVWTIIACCLFGTVGFAQLGVGIQAPLSLVGNFQIGPLLLETGLPLRFDLDSLAAFANLKFQFDTWSENDLTLHPYIGGGAKLSFSNPDVLWPHALVGVDVSMANKPLIVYAQAGIAPGFPTGLTESLALGVRLRF